MTSIHARARRTVTLVVAAITVSATEARAQGTPPAAVVNGYIQYTAALLGLRYSDAQRAELQAQVVSYWAEGRQANIATVTRAAELWQQRMASADADVLATAAGTSLPDVLRSLRRAADSGESDSRWLLNAYYAANPPIAPGRSDGLPLVRAVVDARLELDAFLQREIFRKPRPELDARARDAACRLAAARYAAMTAEEQIALARSPGELAQTRGQWARMGTPLRTMVRLNMGAAVTPEERSEMQMALGQGPGGAQAQMLQRSLAHMRETSEIVMGRGTTWNPSAGRWEQHGGVVTEFNGTVRVP
jgi:hypothetical protein